MRKKQPAEHTPFDSLDCFGEYKRSNPLCAKHCALRLRCAIEQDQNLRMEMIEDMVFAEDQIIKIQ